MDKKKDQGNLNWGIEGKVVTRFPPEPSGYLHIGHTKAALLNQYFAESNNGQLRIRFDDTNQNKEYSKFEPIIIEDLKLLGIENYKISSTSDYFSQIQELCKKLIEKGLAYCDDTQVEQMRKERDEGIESSRRNSGVDFNISVFEQLKKGENKEFCVRAKIDYQNKNKALRDPVIMRVNLNKHHKTGTKFKLYPTYDFACPIVDSIEGITYTLRTTEFMDRDPQYYWFLKALELKNKPRIKEFSRLNFENTVLSKRKLQFYVDNNYVTGWDDPRVPTIRGILRLGMKVESLKKYILMQGASQKTAVASWDKIWAINKKILEAESPRISCIKESNLVQIISDQEFPEITKSLHPKNKELGVSKIKPNQVCISQEDSQILKNDEEFTLMGIGNVIITKIESEEKTIKRILVKQNLEGDFKKTKNKISWISKDKSLRIKLNEYSNLTIGEGSDLDKVFNKNSLVEDYYLADDIIKKFMKKYEVVQFERIGFYCFDFDNNFNLVPYSKQKRKSIN